MTADRADSESAGKMRGRVDESALKLWLLLQVDRKLLTVGLLGVVFVSLLAIALLTPTPVRAIVAEGDPVSTLFQAMVTAIITGVTLVVSINQLVLSQELGPVGDQRERMETAMEYRENAESAIAAPVSPSEPSAFMAALLASIERDAGSLASSGNDELTAYGGHVASQAADIGDRIDDTEFGTFSLLNAALDFNYSEKIREGRRLKATQEELPVTQRERLDSLLSTLQLFAPAREHFKTLYFQWELINLSRGVLYTAIPAFVTAVAMILFFDTPANVPGVTLGVDNMVWLVILATMVTVSPFIILIAYILRITTVAKRTLAISPFVLRRRNSE